MARNMYYFNVGAYRFMARGKLHLYYIRAAPWHLFHSKYRVKELARIKKGTNRIKNQCVFFSPIHLHRFYHRIHNHCFFQVARRFFSTWIHVQAIFIQVGNADAFIVNQLAACHIIFNLGMVSKGQGVPV